MLVSHRHKFVCINIPKTATGTREAAFRDYCEFSLFNPDFKVNYKNLRHTPAYIAKAEFLKNCWDWDNYYKFTFVRNPLFRYISFYNMVARRGNMQEDLGNWLCSDGPNKRCQSYYYNDSDDNLNILDKIYKYEDLQEAMEHVFKTVGIKNPPTLNNPENAPAGGFPYKLTQYYNREIYNRVLVLEKNVIDNFYSDEVKNCIFKD